MWTSSGIGWPPTCNLRDWDKIKEIRDRLKEERINTMSKGPI